MKPLYNPVQEPMRVAGFMSGSGSIIKKLIERQKEFEDTLYKVAVIFSDNSNSKAEQIGEEYKIPVVIKDIKKFYHLKEKKRSDLSIRPEFDTEIIEAIKQYGANLVACGGYMSIASYVLIDAFLGINVHPADLSIERDGKRVYTGGHAVADAIKAGEKHICSTTHIITEEIDAGQILMISKPIEVIVSQTPNENLNRLKEYADWKIFPKTIELIAQGRYSKDDNNKLYFDGKPVPKGITLDDLEQQ